MNRTLIIFNAQWTNVEPGRMEPLEPKTPPLVSIAVDLENRLWVARHNWETTRASFLKALTGAAYIKHNELHLECGRQGPTILLNYVTNGHPSRDGRAVWGQHPQRPGSYAQRSRWFRHDDPSIMTPFERMAEIFDRAVRSPNLETKLKEQFGDLANPAILLPIAGVFAALFGAGFVGGAAAVWCVGRLMGLSQFMCDFYFYQPRAQQLHHIVMNAQRPEQLNDGALLMEEILVQLITDLAMVLGIAALAGAATRLFSALMCYGPDSVTSFVRTNAAAAEAYIRGKGYARRDLLRSADDSPIEPAAKRMYEETAVRNREIIAVREANMSRLQWITSHVWNRAKPAWLKAKSKFGWNGLVCLNKGGPLAGQLESAGMFDMGNLRGVSAEIDAAIDAQRSRPKYKLPTKGDPIDGIDYNFTGANNRGLEGHYVVDMGDRWMLVDALGNPYIADLDVITRQRPGTRRAGEHLPQSMEMKRFPEDDYLLEWEMNQSYHRNGGSPMHDPMQHGGSGASVVHVREAQAKNRGHWSPREKDGTFAKERILVVLPEWTNGRLQGKSYIIDSWSDFQQFCQANMLEFPF